MMLIAALALTAASAPEPPVVNSSEGWFVSSEYDALNGFYIYKSMQTNAYFAEQRIADARIIIEHDGIEFHSFVRNCTDELYDYRQNFVIRRNQDTEKELVTLNKMVHEISNELQVKCKLPIGESTVFMSKLEETFRNLSALNKKWLTTYKK